MPNPSKTINLKGKYFIGLPKVTIHSRLVYIYNGLEMCKDCMFGNRGEAKHYNIAMEQFATNEISHDSQQ